MALDQTKYRKSNLWSHLGKNIFAEISNVDISTFRKSGGLNGRLASWDPYDGKSFRYYKNILYNLVTSMPICEIGAGSIMGTIILFSCLK